MPPAANIRITRRLLLAQASAAFAAPVATAQPARAVVVASKIDTEGALLGSLIAQTLQAHGVPVQPRLQLGPTSILRQALLSGAIDIYPEYTGNGARFFHRQGDPAWHKPQSAWQLSHDLDAPNGIVWLPAAPADNGWGIAVRQDLAGRLAGPTLTALATYLNRGGDLMLAASVEFVESRDALPAFERAYNFHLRQDQILALAGGDTSATMRGASQGISGINAAMAYTTDGALDALHLILLADPLHAQIAFQPAPVLRASTLQAHPEIPAWLAPVFAGLTLPRLRALNARISVDGADPWSVGALYLAGHA
jgi:osmoprotectant transport system substrate-binding protein